MKNFFVGCLIVLLLPGLAACSPQVPAAPGAQASATPAPSQEAESGPQPLIIGILAPLTGPADTFGASTRDGAQLAIDAWNARGGVLGRKVTAVLADGQCDSNAAVSAANLLVRQEHVHYVVGGVCSAESLALAEIAEAQGVVEISPASTMDELTLNPDGSTRQYVFRACYTDSFQGTVAGKFAAETLKVRRAYLLTIPGDNYTVGLANSFEQAFTQGGGEIVGRGEYSAQDTDFSVLFSRVAAANPQIIYLATSYGQANAMVRQAREKGVTAPFLGADGWDSPDLDRQTTDGSYFTTHFSPDDQRPILQDWLKQYQARYQVTPDALAVLGYDATNLMLTAIAQAGVDEPAKVAATLAGLKWEGVTGAIQFNAQHNPIKPAVVMQVKDGQLHYVTTILP
jgi:branched-chain amino acid transport system substrate-binding protein